MMFFRHSSNKMVSVYHPYNGQLYLPSSNSILVINTKSWTQDKTLKPNPDKAEEFSILCISSDGKNLAGYTLDGNIYVYQTDTFQLLSQIDVKGRIISSMIFAPANQKDLILADNVGMMHIFEDATKLQVKPTLLETKNTDEEINFDLFDNEEDEVEKSN